MLYQFIYGNVFSENKTKEFLKKINKINNKVTRLSSSYIHLTSTKNVLSKNDELTLNSLLTYGKKPSEVLKTKNQIIVSPRFGTISPWSSRATDIAQKCDLQIIKIERCKIFYLETLSKENLTIEEKRKIGDFLYDPMTESLIFDETQINQLFLDEKPKDLTKIDILNNGISELKKYNQEKGLALSEDEVEYLYKNFFDANKNPSNAELMMFAQANSEHCRHKIFNATWEINGEKKDHTLFSMIKNTHKKNPIKTVTAYSDNSSVIEGKKFKRFYPGKDSIYKENEALTHYIMKVETHNHPTAISPYPGAATGAGGEIRDEGATGRGSKPKAGLTGFSVSNLHIPEFKHSWEINNGKPSHIASALDIMIDGPIGGASYNNEFGRPNIAGYFRVFEQQVNGKFYGYHKPIMLAGGLGHIDANHTEKKQLDENTLLIQIGGPAMLIGLGGGAASSMDTGSNLEKLDFDSVQRGNPEIQRRAQEVIDRCWQMKEDNPILSIHDVGAGGLSNAFPELINDGGIGANFDIRNIHSEEKGMAPHELWCNEAQERYVLAIHKDSLSIFEKICKRERCPYAIVGYGIKDKHLLVKDSLLENNVVDMDLSILLGRPPKTHKSIIYNQEKKFSDPKKINFEKTIEQIIQHPTVASKNFLIHIGDRSVTGLISQDQMVGPWQVPVSNVAVTKSTFNSNLGECFAVGERTPLAIANAKSSARIAVGESITNLNSAYFQDIKNIKLSANWMAASGDAEEDFKLYEAVQTVGLELCPKLGISIPVGKDSMSMKTKWEDKEVTSPLSLIISAFSECLDVNKTKTPQMDLSQDTNLLYIDLGENKYRMGGSIAEQVNSFMTEDTPDLSNPNLLLNFTKVIQQLHFENKILSYHDRSDGGLISTLLEMAFASHSGLKINLNNINQEIERILFSEELGAVIQVQSQELEYVQNLIRNLCTENVYEIGCPTKSNEILIEQSNFKYKTERTYLQKLWSLNSFYIQSMRDNQELAKQELDLCEDENNPGLHEHLTFSKEKFSIVKNKPRIAILREQGVNGHYEMAAAFYYAGFEAVDVHMEDILIGNQSLKNFQAFVACGGFSYGDVLGAGEGWAKIILNKSNLRDEFLDFFSRKDTIALGVCNGCQMMSNIKELIPGASNWPHFVKNISEQFESRLSMVTIPKSKSIFFQGMHGSTLPIVVAHGEGQVEFASNDMLQKLINNEQISMQYVDNNRCITTRYPLNPNGSELGVTGFTSEDGRFNIMMPHPERVFRMDQNTWTYNRADEFSGWYSLFKNAYKTLTN
ncbi:MAG: phosphoribosylformylglycinamidine synthase [Nitrosomonadales bacterium]